jgi:NAD(P)-dependent dehydrogenase (short-subunit alcohol dehydrogenase family)
VSVKSTAAIPIALKSPSDSLSEIGGIAADVIGVLDKVGVGGAMGDATKIDLAAWDRDFRINVTSMVLMSRFVIPEMRRIGRGSIVNMSSVSGRE